MKAFSDQHLFLLSVTQLHKLLKFATKQADVARQNRIKWDTRVLQINEVIEWRTK